VKWTQSFIRTFREPPADAETISQKLMHQTGMIDKLISGVYSFLPIGLKVLQKVSNIIREEMNNAGGLELLMPSLQPASLWEETGRYGKMGKDMITFQDRRDRCILLGPTHEEVITDIIRKYVKSWKQMPVLLYQIQTKYRDEIRPRFGIIRAREFLMKDAYSFDVDDKSSEISYFKMKDTYIKIFQRCGLKTDIKQADSGVIGGKFSEEFIAEGQCAELEVGHIFKLGMEYSTKMKAVFNDKEGKEKPIIMGCYGIGVSRIVSAIIEGNYDNKGIIWPISVSPYQVLILPLKSGEEKEMAEKIYENLKKPGWEVLLDDRDESAGIKFSDGDLLGIPIWLIFGKKLKEGKVEVKLRKNNKFYDVPIENIEQFIKDILKEL
jgi:prolyl-tRNA synthetase